MLLVGREYPVAQIPLCLPGLLDLASLTYTDLPSVAHLAKPHPDWVSIDALAHTAREAA